MFHIKTFPLLVNVRWKIQVVNEHASPNPCIRAIPKMVCNGFWKLKVTHHASIMNVWVCFCAPNVKCQSSMPHCLHEFKIFFGHWFQSCITTLELKSTWHDWLPLLWYCLHKFASIIQWCLPLFFWIFYYAIVTTQFGSNLKTSMFLHKRI